MLKNYLKIAFRNLVKNKYFSLISIFSLGIAISCFIFTYAYFDHETSYDTSYKDNDKIFRIIANTKFYERVKLGCTSELLSRELRNSNSDFEYVAKISTGWETSFRKGKTLFNEKNFFYAEQDFLNIFFTPFILGKRDGALTRPQTVVLTRSIAQKYFGNSNPIGDEIIIGDKNYEVTGIIPDPPSNTHLKYSVLASFATIEPQVEYRDWTHYGYITYIKLKSSTNKKLFEKTLYNFAENKTNGRQSLDLHHLLQPVSDIHTNTEMEWDVDTHTNKNYLYIMLAVGILTIIMAGINLVNMSVSQSLNRYKEIGIRTVSGATKFSIVYQFFVEALLILFLAGILAVAFSKILAPMFTQLTEIDFSLGRIFELNMVLPLVLIVLLVSAVACIYPALVISSIKPAMIFRKLFTSSLRGDKLKTILMTAQYSVTTILVICFTVMMAQTNYMKNENLGFDKKYKLVLKIPRTKMDFNYLAKEFSGYKSVKASSISSAIMGGGISFGGVPMLGENTNRVSIKVLHLFANEDFIKNYKLKLIAGDKERINSEGLKKGIVVNERFVQSFGFHSANEAVGQFMIIPWLDKKMEILGVVKNFHHAGLQEIIDPVLIFNDPKFYRYITLDINGNTQETISFLKNKWESLLPKSPFDFFFLDDFFNRSYAKEEKTVAAVSFFSWIGISIACFGLIGLTNYNIQRKIKEAGIRKVLGASFPSLSMLFAKKILITIFVAGFIASPVAYFLMNKWLDQYAYRVGLNIYFFIVSIAAVAFISMSLIIYPIYKATTTNPVESLRYE
jgi:putative ABC transport system permease protein